MPRFLNPITITTPGGSAPLIVNSSTVVTNLNADLLDGQHGSFYQNAGNLNAGTIPTGRLSGTYPISISGSADIVSVADTRAVTTTPQTINRSVVFDFKENASNGLNDGGNYFGLMTFRQYGSNTDWSGGLSHQLGFTDNGNVWQRSGSSTTWGAWKKLWDDANDGAGSGLDADLLDGQHGSYYAAASSLGNYLPLTGGTLTGSVYVNTNDAIRVSWQTNDHLWIRGYGLEFGRVTSYLRPGSNNGASLFVGGSTINQIDWSNIDFYSSGRFSLNNNPILHAGNFNSYTLPRGGSWYGVNLPGSRWGGFTANGGEIAFGQDLPNTSQMGVLIDGCYIAGENNGFWSLASNNDWTTRRGMYFDGTYLRFDYNSATAYFSNVSINGNQVLHASNYSSYALPLTGGTLTGTLNGTSAYFSGNIGAGVSPTYRIQSDAPAMLNRTAFGVLDINSNGSPNFIKIQTAIPFSYGAQAYTVNIKGFAYDSRETVDLAICWHQYADTFYATALTSKGSFAPTVRLARESGNVVICLTWSGKYWPKLYVESVHNYDLQAYSTGWTWVDADITGDKVVTLSYTNDWGGGMTKDPYGNLTVTGSVTGTSFVSGSKQLAPGTKGAWEAWKAISADSASSAIGLYGSTGTWLGTLYGDSAAIGFLNSSNNWDLKKSLNGELYATVSGVSQTVLHAGNFNSYALPLSGGTVTGNLTISGASLYHRITDGTNVLQLGLWDGSNCRIEASGRPLYMVSYNGAITIGRSSGTNLVIDTSSLAWGGNALLHAGNYASYLNNTYLRAAGHPGYNDWNVFGNTAQTVNSIFQENFNIPTSTGSSNFPTNAAYKYGTLVNFGSGSDARAQVYISHAGNDLVFRGGWGTASWQTWNRCLTDQNYSAYALPLTGGFVSGQLAVTATTDPAILISGGASADGSAHLYTAIGGVGKVRLQRNGVIAALGLSIKSGSDVNAGTEVFSVSNAGAVTGTSASFSGDLQSGGAIIRASASTAGQAWFSTASYGVSQGDGRTHFGYYTGTQYENYIRGAHTVVNGGFQVVGAATLQSTLSVTGAITQNGQQVLHAGNYNSYAVDNTKRVKQFFWDGLSASTTQARRYEIARIAIDIVNWNQVGTFEIELCEQYYSKGIKKRYAVWYGYSGTRPGLKLVEMTGAGDNNFQVVLGTEQPVSGNQYYLPIYVDVRYYSIVDVRVTTSRQIAGSNPPPVGYTYINSSPTPTNISDFTADSTVDLSPGASAWLVGGNVLLHGGNFNSYAPTLTGTGASGTWGISISGSAVSATTQSKSDSSTSIATTAFSKWLFATFGTGGTTDWNHVSNTMPGTGTTLLRGSDTNGFGPSQYYHPVNFEYAGTGGTGNVTQLAVAYGLEGNDLRMRGRYSGTWTSWVQFLNSSNYNSYAPTLTGTGASGTWNISITGTSRGVGTSDPTIGTGGLWVTTATGLNVARNGTAYVVLDAGNYSSYSPPLAQAVYGENATATTNLSENNLDAALKSGFYTVNKVDNSKLPATSTAVNFLIHCSYVGVGNTAGIDLLTQDSTTSNLFYRNATGAGKGAWRTVLDSANYNSYAPTLTGGGASGTWGISISGSAAQLNGQAASFYQNAGNLNAGTLPSARLSGTYTIDIAGAASSGSRLGLWDGTTYNTGSNTISGTGGRGVNLAPNTYVKQISFEFKNTSFASMGGNYGGLITIAPWDGTAVGTGDPNYQLLFSASAANSTSNPVLRLRAGIDAGWGAWATLIHDANFATAIPNSGVGAGTYNNVTVNAKGIVTGGSNVSYLTGNQSISITGDATGSGTTSISLTLANSGVGAGTYRSVTVDAKGRVTGGTNPTTFSGYGISDIAYGSTGSRNVWTITDWNQTTYQNAHFLSSENTHTNGPTSDYIYGLQTSFHRSGSAYRTQMVTELYSSPVSIWVRNSRDSDVWTTWSKLLHSNNYTDYAPTKTGVGASGSWGINITGSSASCTGNAATATNVAWSGITSKPTTLSGYGITDAINTSATAQTKSGDLTVGGNFVSNGTATVKSNGTRTGTALIKFAQTIGDNYATSFNIDHNLSTGDILVQVVRLADGVIGDFTTSIVAATLNRVTVTFATAPTNSQYRVVVVG